MPDAAPFPDPRLLTARLAALHSASFTTPRPWREDEIAAMLSQAHIFLIEAQDGFLIGSALAGEAELLTLAVSPEARRQGIGRRLLAGFLAEAARRGASEALLEVSDGNPGAIALYEAAGFTLAGRRRGYYQTPQGQRIDALVLRRLLGDAAGHPSGDPS